MPRIPAFTESWNWFGSKGIPAMWAQAATPCARVVQLQVLLGMDETPPTVGVGLAMSARTQCHRYLVESPDTGKPQLDQTQHSCFLISWSVAMHGFETHGAIYIRIWITIHGPQHHHFRSKVKLASNESVQQQTPLPFGRSEPVHRVIKQNKACA